MQQIVLVFVCEQTCLQNNLVFSSDALLNFYAQQENPMVQMLMPDQLATFRVDCSLLSYLYVTMLIVMGLVVSSHNSYVEVLTPSASECDCAWRQDL